MKTLTVAKKDLKNVRRSRSMWAAAVGLGMIAALVVYAGQGYNQTPTEIVQSHFHLLTQLLAVILPIVALAASYLAIAGEREGGGIKFLLSMPNTRWDVFSGKLASRLSAVAVGVGIIFLAASSIALTQYGVFPASVIAGTFAVTLLYGAVFVNIGISFSAAVASRSRAIAGALVSYFVLIILYIFPVIQVKTLIKWVHTSILGLEANPDLYNAVQYTSPFLAYQKAINLVVPEELEQRLFSDSATNIGQSANAGSSGGTVGANTMGPVSVDPDLPIYLTDEFSLVILAFWLVVPLLIGYMLFKGADLE